jgi:hypothetical protein
MVVQLAVGQCRHLRISSEYIYQRALALGVSVALCLVGCKDHGSGSAPAHATPALASVAVLSEGVLSLYDSGAKRVQTAELGDLPAPTLRCWNTSALILSPHSWGRLDTGSSEAKLVWSKLSPKPEGCLNPTLQIRDAVPSKAGALCVTVTDGFSDTATCERTFTLDPMSGSYLPGCQVADFGPAGDPVASPSGRYRVEFGELVEGDETYYRSAIIVDGRGKHSLKLDDLNVAQRESPVTWLAGEAGVVFAGRLITLPELRVTVEGNSACALRR